MAKPFIELLTDKDLNDIHNVSLEILSKIGIIVHHPQVLRALADAGSRVDISSRRVWINEENIENAIQKATKQYVLHGRGGKQVARFGYREINLISSPGQFAWFDQDTGKRRDPSLDDVRSAIKLGDALSNISIVGALGVPTDVPAPIRDVVLTAELLKGSSKPTRCWPVTRRSSHYVLEMYSAAAGGRAALAAFPMVEIFLEPISPLQLPETGLDVILEYLEYGQPVSIGPMSMVTATGPATLAGTLAQENAEILASIVSIQALHPGTAVMYGGIPHIMDPRTSVCSFGAPEQGLMAIAMSQLGNSYGFPVYINVNLTDSKSLDIQAGMEKIGSLILGALAGADLFGHAGIVGADCGASLDWLVADDEAIEYVKRILRGFSIDKESLAYQVVADIGPGGQFLTHEHTVANFRKELWIPRPVWTRDTFDSWTSKGSLQMQDRIYDRVRHILKEHEPEPIEPSLEKELDLILTYAKRELVG